MKDAETSLLKAVRDAILELTALTERECQIEYDAQAATTTGDVFIVVMPGGWQPGPRHRTSGGVNDLVYSVDVGVLRRLGHVPRDRMTKEVFLHHMRGLSEYTDQIYTAVDFAYDVNNRANEYIKAATKSTEGFIEPLKFQGMERRPRLVSGAFFSAQREEPAAAMMRTIQFGGARRITTK